MNKVMRRPEVMLEREATIEGGRNELHILIRQVEGLHVPWKDSDSWTSINETKVTHPMFKS